MNSNKYEIIVDNIEKFKKHFSIGPNVEGNFSVYGRTITFVPNKELEGNTNYIVTIKKGLKMNEDYVFSFTTSGNEDNKQCNKISNISITNDNISTFKTK